jgi:hypothetical protein
LLPESPAGWSGARKWGLKKVKKVVAKSAAFAYSSGKCAILVQGQTVFACQCVETK